MGAGLAKDASQRHPELPKNLAKHIESFQDRIYVYNPIICMPTKRCWRYPSKMKWIEQGCRELVDMARILSSVGDDRTILLPEIGCGLGGLNWERQVRPVVDLLLQGNRFLLVSK